MNLRRMWNAWGVVGPSVETILAEPNCRPGGFLDGVVHVHGGERAIDVEYVAVALTTRVEDRAGDGEYTVDQEFHRQRLTGSFRLDPGAAHEIPFRMDVPHETPITEVYGQRLHGMTMGLATELEVAREVAKSDLDAVAVHPVPAQEAVLDALLRLGFRFQRAGVAAGRVPGVRQSLPFHQAIEFGVPSAYASAIERLEVIFVPEPDRLQVAVEADRRGGVFTAVHEAFGRFEIEYDRAAEVDWAAWLGDWLAAALTTPGGASGARR